VLATVAVAKAGDEAIGLRNIALQTNIASFFFNSIAPPNGKLFLY
jgi:hypothetical protein